MSCLLGHSRPDLVLCGPVAEGDGEYHDGNKESDNEQLNQGIISHLFQQSGIPVIVFVNDQRIAAHLDDEWFVFGFELFDKLYEIFIVLLYTGRINIQMLAGRIVILIGLDDRDVCILIGNDIG
jgi:hypothetical protein